MKRWTWSVVLAALSIATVSTLVATPLPSSAGGFPRVLRMRTPIEKLAHKIDELQEDIDRFGTVVAKQPDVWGEARLTAHRAQYEDLLNKEAGNFKETIQATLRRSDQAFLVQALALQAALGGQQAALVAPGGTLVAPTMTVSAQTPPDGKTDPAKPATVPALSSVGNPPDLTNPPIVPSTKDGATQPGIALEPEIKLDQLSRYLNHLHQLRRINEGDDTSDAPGYSMNLMRFPVSVLPGTQTREGYGAEVTFSVSPRISGKLLASTFESLITNDLLDTLTLPILKAAERKPHQTACEAMDLQEQIAAIQQKIEQLGTEKQRLLTETKSQLPASSVGLSGAELVRLPKVAFTDEHKSFFEGQKKKIAQLNVEENSKKREKVANENKLQHLQKQLAAVLGSMRLPALVTQARLARYPVSSTQLINVFGEAELVEIAKQVEQSLEIDDGKQPHYHDVRSFLAEELDKAWKMLERVESSSQYRVWDVECEGLADDIRLKKDLGARRITFRQNLKKIASQGCLFESLAWAILVDSALLDQRFHADIQRVAAENGNLHAPPSYVHFWGSHPTEDAVNAFCQYVNSRWPIHVFAIDPVTQDQNVADSFSLRREMQMTLSIALASGQINAQEYMQFARRLETELDTIALNRTVVGFSHGTDTFGWRFQPRVQTPPTDSNAKVFFRDLVIGGPRRNEELKTRMLEPGPRECVAVVLMPSVLTQVDVDIRSSWYRLDEPHKRKFGMEDSVTLGRDVVELQSLSKQCFEDRDRYRQADVWRLERAVEQLEKQLPLQNTLVSVPNENALAGMQLFEGGRTCLGPELIGFYGEPGVQIAPSASAATTEGSTALFLVGRNFSMTSTHVTAAGMSLADSSVKILSREVLQVTIPAVSANQLLEQDNGPEIDIHVATPYGVSHHLRIPVAQSEAASKKAAGAAKIAADDAAKAAGEAAREAVAAHVDTAHAGDPSAIKWEVGADKNTSGKIVFGQDSGKVTSFRFDNSEPIELKLKVPEPDDAITGFVTEGKPAPQKIDLAEVEVAFVVTAFSQADKDKPRKAIGKKVVGIVKANQITNYGTIGDYVQRALRGIVELNPTSGVKFLEVEALVRKVGSRAVYAVPGKLRIDVETGTDQIAEEPMAGQ